CARYYFYAMDYW
nr:immunoglobulin heavy chain junction region [Mus musculus]MBK4188938.1 immunoglobulin heavy chain junction region [Mus musculus]